MSSLPSASRKSKKSPSSKTDAPINITLRDPTWAYIHLQHLSAATQGPATKSLKPNNPTSTDLDALTAHLHISAALQQFLGLHGSAMALDILTLRGDEVWIRVRAEDRSAVVAAVGGWVGAAGNAWRVRGRSSWDARVVNSPDAGQDLFSD